MEAEKCADYFQAISNAQSEGWGGVIMEAPKDGRATQEENAILEPQQLLAGVSYEVCQQIIATSDGMPEPQPVSAF